MKTLVNSTQTAYELINHIVETGITPVFDMDGVFIDATHRQICNPDGSLNLEKYREMSTAEHISKDKELPLILALQVLADLGIEYHICTARVLCENTRQWLADRDIKATVYMGRDGENDARRDYQLKAEKLQQNFSREQLLNMVLIDDNVKNCEAAKSIGMAAINVPFSGH